jgi:hypothetical protein
VRYAHFGLGKAVCYEHESNPLPIPVYFDDQGNPKFVFQSPTSTLGYCFVEMAVPEPPGFVAGSGEALMRNLSRGDFPNPWGRAGSGRVPSCPTNRTAISRPSRSPRFGLLPTNFWTGWSCYARRAVRTELAT